MKKTIWLLSFLFIAGFANGDEKLFNKIQRKFDRDPVKGLAYVKKLKSNRSTEPDAYYFLATYYLNTHNKEVKPNRKYSMLNRAASEAYRVKKYSKNHTYLESHSVLLYEILGAYVSSFRDSFLKNKDYDKSERMAKHYNRLTGKSLPTLAQLDSVKEQRQKEAKLLLQVPRLMDGKYYGMPSGDEDLGPFDFHGEKEILKLINAERIKMGLEPLKWSFSLSKAARYHANDMATQRYFDHNTYDRIDGKLVKIGGTFARIRKFYNLRFVNSENIAAGSKLAKDTYYQWYISKGHYANMFNKSSKYVGLGVAYNPDSPYKYYWVFCTAR
jgi:uncharacterized protein YkwD